MPFNGLTLQVTELEQLRGVAAAICAVCVPATTTNKLVDSEKCKKYVKMQ